MMIKCCSKASKADEAVNIFFEMLENGCVPDVLAVDSLIDTLYKGGRGNEAWQIFHQLKEMKIEPTDGTYNTLLSGLGRDCTLPS